jgi:glycosyltransferase involved in cell wall biosynthesis
MNNKVSIVIPTKNSDMFLENAFKSIKSQTYKDIEVIIVDGQSTDKTLQLAKKYNALVYQLKVDVPKGTFDAPYRRNYGVKKSKGDYVYYLDADMELEKNVVKEAVGACIKGGYDAVIIPENSFGSGPWAKAKNLERMCYWGDDSVEAPRFFKKKVWHEVGGLDVGLGGGGDDWDLYQKLLDLNKRVGRTHSMVNHNEGHLKIKKLMKKRFMYGRDSARYISKRPKQGLISYFPIRPAYIRNWKLFMTRPKDTCSFIVMRSAEYIAGFSGIMYSLLKR